MKLKFILLITYSAIWFYLAIDPWYRDDWLLENLLVFMALPILVWADKRIGFSALSLWMLFIFFTLHGIGAHYTYSEMPWFSYITDIFEFKRNHYDRLIHFLYGFLLFLPFYEVFLPFQQSKHSTLLFTFLFLFASSGVYEVIEWLATETTHSELGTAFLGTQGDQWDAQKDMLCGHFGSLLGLLFWYRRKVP